MCLSICHCRSHSIRLRLTLSRTLNVCVVSCSIHVCVCVRALVHPSLYYLCKSYTLYRFCLYPLLTSRESSDHTRRYRRPATVKKVDNTGAFFLRKIDGIDGTSLLPGPSCRGTNGR